MHILHFSSFHLLPPPNTKKFRQKFKTGVGVFCTQSRFNITPRNFTLPQIITLYQYFQTQQLISTLTPLRNTGVSYVSSFWGIGNAKVLPGSLPPSAVPRYFTLARQVCALPAKHRSVEWLMMESATLQYEKHVHLAAAKTLKLPCSAGY